MIVLIGNSPSSGSTLLADLLDSSRHSACGVELNLFSDRNIYSFEDYRDRGKRSSPASSIYVARNGLNFTRLYSYGLDIATFESIVARSQTVRAFAEQFACHFLALRGKDEGGVLFDKTPQNINCIPEFLASFPDSYFIHLVRNPLYVTSSLLKRFSPFIALATWLVDVAKYYKYRALDRIILVRYEDLTETPFAIAAALIEKITGRAISPAELQSGYEKNQYRKIHSKKLTTWSITDYGVVGDANRKQLTDDELTFMSVLRNMRINDKYAKLFDVAPISFVEAVDGLGYGPSVLDTLPHSSGKAMKTAADYKYLFVKWLKDVMYCDASLNTLPVYLNPLVRA